MKIYLLIVLLSICAATSFGQSDAAKPLTNDDIVQMSQMGLNAEIINAKIRASLKTSFDTSPDALKKLLDAKVPDAVIVEMVNPAKPAPVVAAVKESKEPDAVRRAVKALRRLASSTDVGIFYLNYTPLVAEAKTEVEDALTDIETPNIRDALKSSLAEYEYAASVWQGTLNSDFLEGDLRTTAVNQYGTQKRGLLKVVWRNDFLAAIWRQARNKFEVANSLLVQSDASRIDSDDALAGVWQITVTGDVESTAFDMTVTKNGLSYSGILRSKLGNSTPIQIIRDGNAISFSYSEQQKKNLTKIDFKGVLADKIIKGSMIFTLNGKINNAPFTAAKL